MSDLTSVNFEKRRKAFETEEWTEDNVHLLSNEVVPKVLLRALFNESLYELWRTDESLLSVQLGDVLSITEQMHKCTTLTDLCNHLMGNIDGQPVIIHEFASELLAKLPFDKQDHGAIQRFSGMIVDTIPHDSMYVLAKGVLANDNIPNDSYKMSLAAELLRDGAVDYIPRNFKADHDLIAHLLEGYDPSKENWYKYNGRFYKQDSKSAYLFAYKFIPYGAYLTMDFKCYRTMIYALCVDSGSINKLRNLISEDKNLSTQDCLDLQELCNQTM